MWWPALAMICAAGWPGSGLGTVLGIGIGLMVLGLVDFVFQAWRKERGHRPARPTRPTSRTSG
jgi:hypothetical protein